MFEIAPDPPIKLCKKLRSLFDKDIAGRLDDVCIDGGAGAAELVNGTNGTALGIIIGVEVEATGLVDATTGTPKTLRSTGVPIGND